MIDLQREIELVLNFFKEDYETIIIWILAITLVSIFYIKRGKKKKRCNAKIMGKIIDRKPVEIHTYERDLDYNIMPHSKTVLKKYHYVAEYEIDGIFYESSTLESSFVFKKVGTLIEVRYNSKNPRESFIKIDDLEELNLKSDFTWRTFFVIFLIFIVAEVVFYLFFQ